jgi:hypothetical protein
MTSALIRQTKRSPKADLLRKSAVEVEASASGAAAWVVGWCRRMKTVLPCSSMPAVARRRASGHQPG